MWQVMSLGDVCTISSSKRIFAKEYKTEGIPFYRGKEIIEKHNGSTVSTELFISLERYEEIKSKYDVPKKGDILLSSVGTLGVPWLVNEDNFYFKDGNLTWLRSNEKIIPDYLYFWLTSDEAQNQIDSKCIGSTQKVLTIEALKKFKITLPNVEVQKKIVSMIKPIELKIDINRRINNNLEQQAKIIFNHLVINNPNFHSFKLTPLSELCKLITKGTTPTTLGKNFTNSGINFIKVESILENHSFNREKFSYINKTTNFILKRSILHSGDILFTIAGTLGRFALVDDSILPANTNQAVAIIRVNKDKILPEYLYSSFLGNWHNDYYKRHVQQAVQANLSLTTIKSLLIPMLPQAELQKYMELVHPIIKYMKKNEKENYLLAEQKNFILPKLMTGELTP